VKRKNEKAARDGEILFEMEELVPHAKMRVKHKRGCEAKHGESGCAEAGEDPKRNRRSREKLQDNRRNERRGGHAHFGRRGSCAIEIQH
jgi:hypothetical protein